MSCIHAGTIWGRAPVAGNGVRRLRVHGTGGAGCLGKLVLFLVREFFCNVLVLVIIFIW